MIGLTIDGICVEFDGFKAVDNFSMVVNPGELRVLLGANGAGKTTLLDVICGRTRASSGKIWLGNELITDRRPHMVARAGIGRKFQIPSVFRELSVEDNLLVAGLRKPGVLANLRRVAKNERTDEILEIIKLADRAKDPAGYLSHGETQWLELGMLIMRGSQVILLDEPTAGMTGDETLKTSRIINDLKGKHTLIVVEHDMAFVRQIADRITVMHLGKFLAQGRIMDIEANAAVKEAYLGNRGITKC